MAILVTDQGFAPATAANTDTLHVSSDAQPADIKWQTNHAIAIDFPSFADGRGFTIAANLRRMGYSGTLIAKGHVLADQYAMARRSGFDAVEISDELAARQPEDQWLARANWQAHDYQNRLKAC